MAILYEKRDQIAYIAINRPEVLNAIDPETAQELIESRQDFDNDDDLRVAIIYGAGERAFCVGADLKKTMPPPPGDPAYSVASQFWRAQPILDLFHGAIEIKKPMIAAIFGYCIGGGLELALTCDIRIAADNSSFGLTEVQIGSLPGGGGTQRLVNALPLAVAMKMLLTGDRIDARQALQWGLVSDVVAQSELLNTAERFARRIADNGPISVKAIKQVALENKQAQLRQGLLLERLFFGMLRDTQDRLEGRKAFAEKRKPEFRGM